MTLSRRQSKDQLERLDTPAWVTRALLEHCPAVRGMRVIEPCAGAGFMSRILSDEGRCLTTSCDIAPRAAFVQQADTLTSAFWQEWYAIFRAGPTAVVTNPPFSGAAALLRLALGAGANLVSLLVRLTWLEATNDRDDLPNPDQLIIVPRPKFIESDEARAIREAAGKPWGGDNCTVAWATWWQHLDDDWTINERIVRVNRKEKALLERGPWKAVA